MRQWRRIYHLCLTNSRIHHILTTAASYPTINNFNINNPYNSHFQQYQSNLFSISHQNCYKCNNCIYKNIKQCQKCASDHHVCCLPCLSTYRLLIPSFYRCVNCCLDFALHLSLVLYYVLIHISCLLRDSFS